jgi:hypothetical protein
MPKGFSFNREFDFVRPDGLRRATGRPPHEWDIYIVKELIDNALDADDAQWQDDPSKPPCLTVRIEYIRVPKRRSHQLFVSVSNRAPFPIAQLSGIFATKRYTSNKAFLKGLTRGSLGNALKTLLGIPYALRQRVASDWAPDLNPLALYCDGKKYLPRYIVNSTAQTIQFSCSTEQGKVMTGTEIGIGVDHFEQEMPRMLADIEHLAEQYHLCNPHAWFSWTVEIDEQLWEMTYPADPDWAGKFRGLAPVQWYSQAAFQDLLGALCRTRSSETGDGTLSLEDIMRRFAGNASAAHASELDRARVATIVTDFGQTNLSESDVEGPVATRLYFALCKHSSRFESVKLGAIGESHIRTALARTLPCADAVLYDQITDDGSDPSAPFVIEAAVVGLEGSKRQMLTAINYTPTYGDPFLSRWLTAPIKADEAVLGLRGLLDAYEIHEDSPVALFLHLICPNIEHHEFSKTEIDHLPFKKALGLLLDRLLTNFRQTREEEELRLERTVVKALEDILHEIGDDERFVFDQLLEKLYSRLSTIEVLTEWLATPQALSRLKTHINNYQSRNAVLTHRVARPAAGTVSLPLHPDRHFSVSTEYLSRELLADRHVNKLLYVQAQEIEPVVVENGWLCRMDMALLHNPPGHEGLREAILQCAASSGLIMVLHDADEAGCSLSEEMQNWLKEAQLNPAILVDLGLEPNAGSPENRLTRLVQMMPNELAAWLTGRFESLGIERKSVPPFPDVRRHISERFERLILGHLWGGVSQQFEMTRLIGKLDSELQFATAMHALALDQSVKKHLDEVTPTESYAAVLDHVVLTFFSDFMRQHADKIDEIVLKHLAQAPGGPSQ